MSKLPQMIKQKTILIESLIRDVMTKNYSRFGEYLDYFSKNLENYEYKYYLYLMSLFAKLPSVYNQQAKEISLNDVLLPSESDRDVSKNEIRTDVFSQDFYEALGKIRVFYGSKTLIGSELLELRLILEAKNHVKDISRKVKMLIEAEKLEEAQEMLEIEGNNHILKKNQAIYLSLLKDILAMEKSGTAVEPENSNEEATLYELVVAHDYDRALVKNGKTVTQKSIPGDFDVFGILLRKALFLKEINVQRCRVGCAQLIDSSKVPDDSLLSTILTCLLSGNAHTAMKLIDTYISKHNLQVYDYLIKSLMMVAIIEEDETCTDLMVTISEMIYDRFSLNLAKYIGFFEEYLKEGNYDLARIYLHIIVSAHQRSQCDISKEEVLAFIDKMDLFVFHLNGNDSQKVIQYEGRGAF